MAHKGGVHSGTPSRGVAERGNALLGLRGVQGPKNQHAGHGAVDGSCKSTTGTVKGQV